MWTPIAIFSMYIILIDSRHLCNRSFKHFKTDRQSVGTVIRTFVPTASTSGTYLRGTCVHWGCVLWMSVCAHGAVHPRSRVCWKLSLRVESGIVCTLFSAELRGVEFTCRASHLTTGATELRRPL